MLKRFAFGDFGEAPGRELPAQLSSEAQALLGALTPPFFEEEPLLLGGLSATRGLAGLRAGGPRQRGHPRLSEPVKSAVPWPWPWAPGTL